MDIVIVTEVVPYDDWASLGSKSGVRNVVTTIEREVVFTLRATVLGCIARSRDISGQIDSVSFGSEG